MAHRCRAKAAQDPFDSFYLLNRHGRALFVKVQQMARGQLHAAHQGAVRLIFRAPIAGIGRLDGALQGVDDLRTPLMQFPTAA